MCPRNLVPRPCLSTLTMVIFSAGHVLVTFSDGTQRSNQTMLLQRHTAHGRVLGKEPMHASPVITSRMQENDVTGTEHTS